MQIKNWDKPYEWKAVLLLTLGFGLVGLDRWIMAPLAPAIMKDLALSYQDIGMVFGALGMTWGVFAILMGNLSDRFGHRKILIGSMIFFSLTSGFTGYATGLISLVLIRSLMGVAEGAFCPTSFAATALAAHPSRRGSLQGLQQSGYALFGLGLGPIIATQLLLVVPQWQHILWIVAIPGFILAALMYSVIREPKDTPGAQLPEFKIEHTHEGEKVNWSRLFKTKNVVLSMVGLLCAMSCIFVVSAMLPMYLQDYLKLDSQKMGFVMSAIGIGGFLGQFLVPTLSDWLGRRVTAILGFLGTTIFIVLFMQLGANVSLLFTTMLFMAFFSFGLVALLAGPIASESAPVGLVASAIGLVVGAGEIFGGGIAPVISGFVAQTYGIQNIFYLSLTGVALGLVLSFFFTETAPRKLAKQQLKLESAVVG